MRKGLIQVYCGTGKGKTTAALGLALRAGGYRMRTAFIQFLKSSNRYGELKALKRLHSLIEIIQVGAGCKNKLAGTKSFICTGCGECHIDPQNPAREDGEAAQKGLKLARQKIISGRYDIVVLDELNYAIQFGLIGVEEVISLLAAKPASVEVVITGAGVTDRIINAADLVTEMIDVKHHYRKGITGAEGIDY
jgi:cob(I)alamin adenosyltransferase